MLSFIQALVPPKLTSQVEGIDLVATPENALVAASEDSDAIGSAV